MHRLWFSLMVALLTLGPWVESPGAQGLEVSLKERGFRESKTREPGSAAIFADAVIGRPVGVVTTVVGTAAFVASLPFTAAARDVRSAARGMVVKPAGWTFKRPLGGSNPKFRDEGVFPLP